MLGSERWCIIWFSGGSQGFLLCICPSSWTSSSDLCLFRNTYIAVNRCAVLWLENNWSTLNLVLLWVRVWTSRCFSTQIVLFLQWLLTVGGVSRVSGVSGCQLCGLIHILNWVGLSAYGSQTLQFWLAYFMLPVLPKYLGTRLLV